MKRLPMTLVATLLMVAVSAPAQRDVRGERGGRAGIVSSQRHVAGEVSGSRHVAKARSSSRQVAGRQATSRYNSTRRGGSRPVASHRGGSRRVESRSIRSGRAGNQLRRGRGHGGVFVDPICTTNTCEPVRRVQRHGYWKTVCERVLVTPGRWHRQYVPAVYGWLYDDCGHRFRGIVKAACYQRVWCPPRYENRTRRIWVGC